MEGTFFFRVYGARGHGRGHGSSSEGSRGTAVSNWSYDLFDTPYSPGVVHVKDGVALTKEGEEMLRRAECRGKD